MRTSFLDEVINADVDGAFFELELERSIKVIVSFFFYTFGVTILLRYLLKRTRFHFRKVNYIYICIYSKNVLELSL